jgi:cytoskeletal protein CcmA (bactofilin family)
MFGRATNQPKAATPTANTPRKMSVPPSVISADMYVLGNIISSDGLLDIDGKIEGNVRCKVATVRQNGRVKGDVVAEMVHVYGEIEGLVKAKSVILYSSARVQGTIMHESLSIEDGAFVDGKFKRTDKVTMDDELSKSLSSAFDNDNDEPASAEELKVLENLRLIS